jgi:hypothetical protein
MRFALRAAAIGRLEQGWLYLPSSEKPQLETVCLIVDADPDDDSESLACAQGFPQEGLDTATIEDTAKAARQLENPPSDELLLESFVYYWRFDAWLPSPGAADPPPWEETKKKLDREFFEALGVERSDVPCRSGGCQRGAIHQSVLCRIHHYEMIKKEPCPFTE